MKYSTPIIANVVMPRELEDIAFECLMNCYRSDSTVLGQRRILLHYNPPEAELIFLNKCYSNTGLQIGVPIESEVSDEEIKDFTDYMTLCLQCEIKNGSVLTLEFYTSEAFIRVEKAFSESDILRDQVFLELVDKSDPAAED